MISIAKRLFSGIGLGYHCRREQELSDLSDRCLSLAHSLSASIDLVRSGCSSIKLASEYNGLRAELAKKQIYLDRYQGDPRQFFPTAISTLKHVGEYLADRRDAELRIEFKPKTFRSGFGPYTDQPTVFRRPPTGTRN